ncbi:arginine--tRNA ligase [Gemella bergeri ATCC 700627]|uniref:Arginine--tRNA ligase n=1 Tax=Gemella bergeri ATCC 700627 TaxID=1321820 RepID=U2QL97_9BACL|nr:arginine--tRNA ligase [Gemella bergeri]ERK56964.1 arginine--tRNA ligase [Gemella bergeri ATCC 700627]
MKTKIVELLQNSLKKLNINDIEVYVETPKNTDNGDFSSNVAMQLTRVLRKNPRIIAEEIISNIEDDESVEKIEIAGPGFINFYVKKSSLGGIINKILKERDNYGKTDVGNGKKVLLEYVSANPTGTLHVGHARNAAYSDSLARIMKKAGYNISREYYINDAGNQINNLVSSAIVRYKQALGLDAKMPEDAYHGEDIKILGKELKEKFGDSLLLRTDLEEFIRNYAIEYELNNIKKDLGDFGLEYDVYFSEKSLYQEGAVDKALASLREQGFVYEKDGALWLETTALGTGDDKDRVLIKADGALTYLTSDIAYHKNKLDRGFDLLIDVLGADHHGYIGRLKASIVAMGYKAEQLEVLIMQMVQLLNNGEVVKMSKRTGKSITLRDLIDEVGKDAARYFLVMRSADSHLDFDFAVAKEQSSDNPLYYVQYAHARICSILRQAEEQGFINVTDCDYELLTDDYSVDLLKNLAYFPEIVSQAAINYEPHRICNYLQTLASSFHKFYNNNKVITENKEQSQSYLALITAVKVTIKNALELIGVSAPEKM